MKRGGGLGPVFRVGVAKHVQRDSTPKILHRADPIDGLLHLAVTAVAALDGIGGGREKLLIQERQGLIYGRREYLLQFLTHSLEATNTGPKFCEFPQGCVRSTAAVKQTVDLVHDAAERAECWLTSADPAQCLGLGWRQMMLDKEMAVIKKIGDLSLEPLLDPCPLGRFPFSRTTSLSRRDTRMDGLPYFCSCPQDRLGQISDDVELADLVRDITEDLQNRPGIESRTVGRDALEFQTTAIEDPLEATEEPQDIYVCRIVIKDFVDEPLELSVVHDREYAEGTIVELIRGNIAGEITQGPIEVVTLDACFAFFFPTPRPSSEQWRRVRRHGGLARDAMKLPGTEVHLQRPAGQPSKRRGGCSCSRATQGQTRRH